MARASVLKRKWFILGTYCILSFARSSVRFIVRYVTVKRGNMENYYEYVHILQKRDLLVKGTRSINSNDLCEEKAFFDKLLLNASSLSQTYVCIVTGTSFLKREHISI
jgi:hypothetical protein